LGGKSFLAGCLAVGFAVGLGVAFGALLGPPAPTSAATTPEGIPARSESVSAEGNLGDCAAAPLEERAGQVLVVGLPEVTTGDEPLVDEVAAVGVGGVLITQTNVESEWQVRGLIRALRRASERPLLVATDEEPGRVSSFRALIGSTSSARTLARRGDRRETRRFARDLGEELSALGIDVDLAPVVDVDGGPAGGIIGDRSFSGDTDTVTEYGLAFSEGLTAAGVHPTAKHFPGHGRSPVDSQLRLGSVDATREDLAEEDLPPFVAQIEAGVPLVMTNHVAYEALDPELPASLAAPTYELLRDLGFEGVAITDSVGMGAVHQHWDFPRSAVMAIAAGADAVLATDGSFARVMRDSLVAAVASGELDKDRLDEAVSRMLTLKGEDPASMVCPDRTGGRGPTRPPAGLLP
jgi:beta-N-acetylhexosaminidase